MVAGGSTSPLPELVLNAGARLAEGPIWDSRDEALLWVDIPAGLVHRLRPDTGVDTAFEVGSPVGAVGCCASGGLILAVRDGFARCGPSGEGVTLVAAVEINDPTMRMNDGKCDPAGRFWAGTITTDGRTSAGRLYRLGADYDVRAMVEGVTASNGLDWSPDRRTMYYADSPTGGVDAFDFDLDEGVVTKRRRLFDVQGGRPDGLTVDAHGGIWVAMWKGWAVRRYTPDGRLDVEVPIPAEQVTSCTFGGPNLDTLYVTTARQGLGAKGLARQPHAGGIFRIDPRVNGMPPSLYAG